jgi:erythromycin esterase
LGVVLKFSIFSIIFCFILFGINSSYSEDDISPWYNWVKKNYVEIQSLDSEDFSDLEALIPYFENKRLIQLGESSHGAKEFNKIKVRLIKFLHQRLGFEVLAFESGLYECMKTNDSIGYINPTYLLYSCPFGVWSTKEVLQIFEYIEGQHEKKPLIISGFDIQVSSPYGAQNRAEYLSEIISKLDREFAEHFLEADQWFLDLLNISHDERKEKLKSRDKELIALYTEYSVLLRIYWDELLQNEDISEKDLKFIDRAILNLPKLVNYLSRDFEDIFGLRDKAMGENLIWLMDTYFPDKKIIVWAHNFHAAYNNHEGEVMGSFLKDRRDEIYTIGLYMQSGESALNNREPLKVGEIKKGSLEDIVGKSGTNITFLDFTKATQSEETSFLFQETACYVWGAYPDSIIPKDYYDGVILLKETSLPDYLF